MTYICVSGKGVLPNYGRYRGGVSHVGMPGTLHMRCSSDIHKRRYDNVHLTPLNILNISHTVGIHTQKEWSPEGQGHQINHYTMY